MVPVKTVLASRPGWKMTPGRADQLADHDPLGAVDDEGALVGHDGEVPHEDRLLLDLARAGVHEPGAHEDRRGVGHVLLLALLHRELRRRAQVGVGRVELELEAQLAGEVLDRADVVERLRQAAVQEPLEGVPLDGDEIGQRQRLVDVGKRKTFRAVGPCRQRPTPPSCKANGARTGYCGGSGAGAARQAWSAGSTTTAGAAVRGVGARATQRKRLRKATGAGTATSKHNRKRTRSQPPRGNPGARPPQGTRTGGLRQGFRPPDGGPGHARTTAVDDLQPGPDRRSAGGRDPGGAT